MTIRDSLLGISAYPIPERTIETIALKRGLGLDYEVDEGTLQSYSFRLATADLLMWLYGAPNVAQGGQSYNFTSDQRELWRKQAMGIYGDLGADAELAMYKSTYGYKGSRL